MAALEELYPEFYDAGDLSKAGADKIVPSAGEGEPQVAEPEEDENTKIDKFREFKDLQVHEWMQRAARR